MRSKKGRLKNNIEEETLRESIDHYNTRVCDRCEAGKNCCALRILGAQDDFANEVSLLEMIITTAGHDVISIRIFTAN